MTTKPKSTRMASLVPSSKQAPRSLKPQPENSSSSSSRCLRQEFIGVTRGIPPLCQAGENMNWSHARLEFLTSNYDTPRFSTPYHYNYYQYRLPPPGPKQVHIALPECKDAKQKIKKPGGDRMDACRVGVAAVGGGVGVSDAKQKIKKQGGDRMDGGRVGVAVGAGGGCSDVKTRCSKRVADSSRDHRGTSHREGATASPAKRAKTETIHLTPYPHLSGQSDRKLKPGCPNRMMGMDRTNMAASKNVSRNSSKNSLSANSKSITKTSRKSPTHARRATPTASTSTASSAARTRTRTRMGTGGKVGGSTKTRKCNSSGKYNKRSSVAIGRHLKKANDSVGATSKNYRNRHLGDELRHGIDSGTPIDGKDFIAARRRHLKGAENDYDNIAVGKHRATSNDHLYDYDGEEQEEEQDDQAMIRQGEIRLKHLLEMQNTKSLLVPSTPVDISHLASSSPKSIYEKVEHERKKYGELSSSPNEHLPQNRSQKPNHHAGTSPSRLTALQQEYRRNKAAIQHSWEPHSLYHTHNRLKTIEQDEAIRALHLTAALGSGLMRKESGPAVCEDCGEYDFLNPEHNCKQCELIRFHKDRAGVKKQAYDTYMETGERSTQPGDVVEVVDYSNDNDGGAMEVKRLKREREEERAGTYDGYHNFVPRVHAGIYSGCVGLGGGNDIVVNYNDLKGTLRFSKGKYETFGTSSANVKATRMTLDEIATSYRKNPDESGYNDTARGDQEKGNDVRERVAMTPYEEFIAEYGGGRQMTLPNTKRAKVNKKEASSPSVKHKGGTDKKTQKKPVKTLEDFRKEGIDRWHKSRGFISSKCFVKNLQDIHFYKR